MANKLARQGQKMAFKVLFLQSVAVVLLSIGTFVVFDGITTLSFFFGGLMNIIPNSMFALLAFRFSGASQNELVVRSFSQGAKLKLIITVIIAIVAFYGLKLEPLPLFVGFMVTTFCQWAAMVKMQTN